MEPLSREHRDTSTDKGTDPIIYRSQQCDTRSGVRGRETSVLGWWRHVTIFERDRSLDGAKILRQMRFASAASRGLQSGFLSISQLHQLSVNVFQINNIVKS